MRWGTLFERAQRTGPVPTVETIRTTLATHRSVRVARDEGDDTRAGQAGSPDREAATGETPDPARVVADADVLAADLLCGGDARAALDHVRRHSWMTLVASSVLLGDAAAVIEELGTAELASAWRGCVEADVRPVDHPAGDHPALASAAAGRAAHVVSFDDDLVSAQGNLSLRAHLRVSVRTPAAFDRLFDPARLYPAVAEGDYPGPDRDPRA